MTTELSKISYRPDIQGLRAVAIALVLAAHANIPGFAGGFIGVDVFFVLSGYLITGLLVQEGLSTGEIRYGRFLARRLRRLLPALLVMLIVVLVVALLMLSAYETRMQSGSILFSATWTSNFFFAFVERDYFSALQAKDLFLHTWSLGVEEQFYVVWPVLMACTFFLVAGKARVDRARHVLFGVLIAVFVASLLLCLYWSKTQPLLSFYMMPSRGWQFALGALVFVWLHPLFHTQSGQMRRRTAIPAGLPVGFLGLLLILGSALMLNAKMAYPGYLALFPSVGAAMVIAAGTVDGKAGASGLLAARPVVWLGDRSYSLYLWHWPVFLLGKSYGLFGTVPGVAFLIGVSVLISMLSYRFIEIPFWKGRFSLAATIPTVVLSALAMLAVIGVSDSLRRHVYGVPANTATAQNYEPRADVPKFYYIPPGCDSWHSSAEVVPCSYGQEDASSTVVLLGDSIGLQWYSLFTELFITPDRRVVVLTKSACPIVDEEYYYDKIGATYDVCTTWRSSVFDYLRDLKPDIVFVGSASSYDFSETQWIDGTSRVLSTLTAVANDVVIIPGTPALTFDGPSCLDEPYRFSSRLPDSHRECEEALTSSRSDEVAAFLERSADSFPNAQVLSLGDLVCPEGRCAARREDGLTVFRDQEHLTKSFVNAQIPEVRDRLQAMGLPQNR